MNSLGNKQIMADNILYYMNLNNKTRNDLCKDLGFKYTTVTGWLAGEKYPRIDKIEIMANYFGIQKSDLVEKHDFTAAPKDQMDVEIVERLNRLSAPQKKAFLEMLRSLEDK